MKIEEVDKNFKVISDNGEDTCFIDILNAPFKIYGVTVPGEYEGFHRMNPEIAEKVNNGVKTNNYHTAGGRVTFSTDSPFVTVRASIIYACRMGHMAFIGSCGFDIYENAGNEDVYRGSFFPPVEDINDFTATVELPGSGMRNYTIDMPLYSGVKKLEIGIKSGFSIAESGMNYKPVLPFVYYGSSITQGGCASRPGNAYQSIITRKTGIDHLNLGFSGSAMGEMVMAEYIAGLNMSVFVCDYDHNAPSSEHLEKTLPPFVETVRQAHPDLPIIMMSRPQPNLNGEEIKRRDFIKSYYEKRKSEGDGNVYFVDGSKVSEYFGGDSITVDNCHPNDLGFMCMADALLKILDKII